MTRYCHERERDWSIFQFLEVDASRLSSGMLSENVLYLLSWKAAWLIQGLHGISRTRPVYCIALHWGCSMQPGEKINIRCWRNTSSPRLLLLALHSPSANCARKRREKEGHPLISHACEYFVKRAEQRKRLQKSMNRRGWKRKQRGYGLESSYYPKFRHHQPAITKHLGRMWEFLRYKVFWGKGGLDICTCDREFFCGSVSHCGWGVPELTRHGWASYDLWRPRQVFKKQCFLHS